MLRDKSWVKTGADEEGTEMVEQVSERGLRDES